VVHRGVAVDSGYPNWTDTDMIRDADRYAVLRAHMPLPARRVHPVERVAAPPGDGSGAAPYDRVRAGLAAAGPTGARGPAALVLRVTRRALPRLEAEEPVAYTGPLGAGGLADRAARAPRKN